MDRNPYYSHISRPLNQSEATKYLVSVLSRNEITLHSLGETDATFHAIKWTIAASQSQQVQVEDNDWQFGHQLLPVGEEGIKELSTTFARIHGLNADVCERACVLHNLLSLMWDNNEIFHTAIFMQTCNTQNVTTHSQIYNTDHVLCFDPPISTEELAIHYKHYSCSVASLNSTGWLDIAMHTPSTSMHKRSRE